MRAYSMDLRERVLLESDAGVSAAAVAANYHVSASWVRRLKQRRRLIRQRLVRPLVSFWRPLLSKFSAFGSIIANSVGRRV